MEIFEYLTGRGGFLILALFVVLVVLYNKISSRRKYFKTSPKKKK